MKVRIVCLLSALLLLFVMIGGCSSSGSTSVNDVLKILPDSVSNVFVADWSKMTADPNLQGLWNAYKEKLNTASMEEFLGVNTPDIESMTMASGGSTYYIVMKGKFSVENIRTVLTNQNFKRQDDYLRVEVWNGNASIAFLKDMMILTMSIDSLKTMIRLNEGAEKGSFYNSQNFNGIINKLPAGIFTLLSAGGDQGSTSTGMSFGVLSADSLSFSRDYLFTDSAAAVTGKTNIESTFSDNFTGTVDTINQKNSIVEIKGSMSISDFMASTYFVNMGF